MERATSGGPRSPWWRGLAALLAGALPAPVFPAPGWWWWAPFCLVPWLLLLRSAPSARRAALDGWLGGLGFMLAVHHWLMPSLHVFTLALAALLGLAWAPWGSLVRALLTGPGTAWRAVSAPAGVASGWLVIELVRSWQGLGGPWGLLGASQWQVGPALRLFSVGGVWLVSLLLVAVNTALVVVATCSRARRAAVAAGAVVAAAAAGGALWAPRPETAERAVRVAVVQPGVITGAAQRFDRQERLTAELAGRGAELVVWGESSVGFDLTARPDLADRLAALSRRTGAQLLVNVDARRHGRPGISKTSVLVGPSGPVPPRYDKMRLVPFGEYVPARPLLGWATSVGRAAGEDRHPGNRQVLMESPGGLRVGPLVCFETAFPDLSRRLARAGAGLLVAQSATSTFQESWAPGQHASLAAVRAAESGRPVVHATLTGVSAVFDASGRPVGPRLGTELSTTGLYRVHPAAGSTAYVRFGDWAVYAAVGWLVVLGGVAVGRRVRGRAGL
ncbi:apolipoprotein N-acyltransferase [Streptomyces sp. NPDC058374]|uniref:apolipoprotein N-acyltransferase n=1 Tax=Streptomyces sp. NPDC058374 TaxID=3346466 RepID=UPI0036595C12